MRATSILVLLALALVPGSAKSQAHSTSPEPTATTKSRPEMTGTLSRVVLLRSWKLDEATAATRHAPTGLGFEFLIVRSPGASGQFTLAELRDAKVRGSSYRALTTSALGKEFEPHSSIEAPKNVRFDSRSVADAFEVTGDDAVVMRTFLFGAALPSSGEGTVTVDVGWGKRTEKLEFHFDLAKLRVESGAQ